MDIGKFDEPRKPNRKCPYGFICKNHPWGKHKITKDCKYYSDCKRITKKLIKVSTDQDRHEEYIDEIAEDMVLQHTRALSVIKELISRHLYF